MDKKNIRVRLSLIGAGGILLALAAAILFYFDPSNYGFYPTCLFHQATGLLCPGCGCLRATHQLLHGRVYEAFHFNPLLVLALPVVLWFGVIYLFRRLHQEPVQPALAGKWMWLILGVALLLSIWRNVPGTPFVLPSH